MKIKFMKTRLLYTAIIAGTLSLASCELDEYNPHRRRRYNRVVRRMAGT